MSQIGFSAEKYIEEQSKYILERINHGGVPFLLFQEQIPGMHRIL